MRFVCGQSQECEQWIADAEAAGFKPSRIRGGAGNTFEDKEVRSSCNVVIVNEQKAELLFERVKEYLEPERNMCRLRGVSARMSFLRYIEGGQFLVSCSEVVLSCAMRSSW